MVVVVVVPCPVVAEVPVVPEVVLLVVEAEVVADVVDALVALAPEEVEPPEVGAMVTEEP